MDWLIVARGQQEEGQKNDNKKSDWKLWHDYCLDYGHDIVHNSSTVRDNSFSTYKYMYIYGNVCAGDVSYLKVLHHHFPHTTEFLNKTINLQ